MSTAEMITPPTTTRARSCGAREVCHHCGAPAGHGLSVFYAGISGAYLQQPHNHPLATTPRLGGLCTLAPGGAAAWRALEQRLEQHRAARAGVGQAPQDRSEKTRRGEAGRVAWGKLRET
jgi:hypothetical protein